ncbi:putative c6 finger domain [Phaeomoniella chlamydospora]|uniref:Putative c6 finger domain n=1 Tax=Phaeomoniella chlamydospora TaxID=158046 RepID=A0A0G2EY69_PHACM|nr:putative c6 finger domain [Phaeomoniella chlamydospora]
MRPISQQLHSNLYSLWTRTFAPALGHLLETAWFEGSTSTSILLGNHPHKNIELEWEFAHFVRMVSDTQQDDPTIPSREARLIWRFFRLAQYYTNTVNDAPSDAYEDAMLTSRRINVLQALLTGESLQSNPLNPSTIYGSSEMENYPVELQLKERESEFWYNLGNFTTRLAPTDQPNESAREASQESLTRMRYVLDAYENRDLLYSIAICRFFGELYRQAVPETQSDRASYFVAKGFIESEVTRGSSTVMKTVSRIAMRSWPEL